MPPNPFFRNHLPHPSDALHSDNKCIVGHSALAQCVRETVCEYHTAVFFFFRFSWLESTPFEFVVARGWLVRSRNNAPGMAQHVLQETALHQSSLARDQSWSTSSHNFWCLIRRSRLKKPLQKAWRPKCVFSGALQVKRKKEPSSLFLFMGVGRRRQPLGQPVPIERRPGGRKRHLKKKLRFTLPGSVCKSRSHAVCGFNFFLIVFVGTERNDGFCRKLHPKSCFGVETFQLNAPEVPL